MLADKHQSFIKLALSFLMEVARQNTQSRKLIKFLQCFKKKVLQLLLCSIVIQNILIFCGGPVMFIVFMFLPVMFLPAPNQDDDRSF